MNNTPKESQRYVTSLLKGLEVLEYIENNQPASLQDMSERLDINKSRLMRLCGTLEYCGYITRDVNKKYRLGNRAFSLGRSYENNSPVISIIKASLETIYKELGQIVSFVVLSGRAMVCLAIIGDSDYMSRDYLATFDDFHVGVCGKIFLTFGPPELRSQFFSPSSETTYASYTPNTITSQDKLYESLQKIKNDGYCLSIEERMIGAASLGVPVFNNLNTLVGVISLAGEKQFFAEDLVINKYVPIMKDVAAKLRPKLLY